MPLLVDEDITLQQKEAAAGAKTGEDGASFTAVSRDTDSLYKRFLKLPVPVVILALWLVGVVLVGFCAIALYDLALPWVEALAEA
jgi:hypothetical protein